ncbi:MAG: Jag N-terminal domain-containing protein [Candidatus Gygaella obscura]|nr:Jag N-terminal domain-containing protein [Candidatus Gygaella obscura]
MENSQESKLDLKEIEVTGKTTQEAIHKALDILKVPKSKIKIKILSEEEKGLFGMPGSKLAKIRASVVPQTQDKK